MLGWGEYENNWSRVKKNIESKYVKVVRLYTVNTEWKVSKVISELLSTHGVHGHKWFDGGIVTWCNL